MNSIASSKPHLNGSERVAAPNLLALAIERVRPMLDPQLPLTVSIRTFWAAAKNARRFAADDILESEFLRLADETGLTADLRRREDISHVLRWALRGLNPFW
jgi:hypothetical protein